MFQNIGRDLKDIKKTQMDLQRFKIIISEMREADGINGWLHILEEKISERTVFKVKHTKKQEF